MKKILFFIIFVLFSINSFTACITIKDLDTKVVSKGKKFVIYAYKVKLDSTCDVDVIVKGKISAYDDDDFRLYSTEFTANVPKFGDTEYSDTMKVRKSVADQIDKFVAGGSVYGD